MKDLLYIEITIKTGTGFKVFRYNDISVFMAIWPAKYLTSISNYTIVCKGSNPIKESIVYRYDNNETIKSVQRAKLANNLYRNLGYLNAARAHS